jgi:zinc/manganese transport system substrate-binding protein
MHKKIVWLLGMLMFSTLFVAGCAGQKTKPSGKIEVISTLNFYGEVAKKVGGDRVKVTNIIDNPTVDPHDYEPTTKTAKLMTNANIVVENGVGTDTWVQKITPQKKSVKVLNVGKLVNKSDGDNPHLWYKLSAMETLANHLATELGKKDPKHKKEFIKNAKSYVESLKPVQQKIEQIKQKSMGKKVAVTEPVYDYTLSELGYKVSDKAFALAIENETDPSPKMVEKLQKDVKDQRIEFIVNNQQTGNKVIDELLKLAKKNDIPVINVTETMPKGKNYQTWMLSQLNQISKIQEGKN